MRDPAWHVANKSHLGMPTCLTVDYCSRHWACVGTDLGRLVVWDLRFRLPVSTLVHPAGTYLYINIFLFILNVVIYSNLFSYRKTILSIVQQPNFRFPDTVVGETHW